MIEALEEEFGSIDLSIGDMVIESSTGDIGVLMERVHRIDMALDDMYFWKIRWTSSSSDPIASALGNFLEEDYLKMSIFLGIMIWQSIKGESIEL